MKGPHSSLRGLLRYRSALERAAWSTLQGANSEVVRATEELRKLESQKEQTGRERVEMLARGASGAELMLVSSVAIEQAIRRAAEAMSEATTRRDTAQDEFRTCRREREVVETAIARQDARYLQQAERREQVQQDDATLRRLSRYKDSAI